MAREGTGWAGKRRSSATSIEDDALPHFRSTNRPLRRFADHHGNGGGVLAAAMGSGFAYAALLYATAGTVLNLRTTTTQKCESVPRRDRI